MEVTHEVRLVHVKGSGKNVHIIVGVKISVHEYILIIFRGHGVHAVLVVQIGHKSELVRCAAEGLGRIIEGRTVSNVNRLECAMSNALNDEILKKQILIILRALVGAVRDLVQQELHRVICQECPLEILCLDCHRVLCPIIERVERRADIRKGALKLT